MSFAEFACAAAAIAIAPGPTNSLLAACGSTLPLRRAVLLPSAGSLAYLVAILLVLTLFAEFADVPLAIAGFQLLSAAWLSYQIAMLLRCHEINRPPGWRAAFLRIFATTCLNPKVLLVATVLIPAGSTSETFPYVTVFVLLSHCSGVLWVLFGSSMPATLRRRASILAAAVLASFVVYAVQGAVSKIESARTSYGQSDKPRLAL